MRFVVVGIGSTQPPIPRQLTQRQVHGLESIRTQRLALYRPPSALPTRQISSPSVSTMEGLSPNPPKSAQTNPLHDLLYYFDGDVRLLTDIIVNESGTVIVLYRYLN